MVIALAYLWSCWHCQPNYGHFAYGTLHLLDSSSTVWSIRLLDTGPRLSLLFRLFASGEADMWGRAGGVTDSICSAFVRDQMTWHLNDIAAL